MPRVPCAVDRNNFVNRAFDYSEGIDGAVENCRASVIGKLWTFTAVSNCLQLLLRPLFYHACVSCVKMFRS